MSTAVLGHSAGTKNANALRELVELVARRLHEPLAQRQALDSTNPNLAVPDPRRG